MTIKQDQHWEGLHGKAGVIHLGSDEMGMRTACGQLLHPANLPHSGMRNPGVVNCFRCRKTYAWRVAELRATM